MILVDWLELSLKRNMNMKAVFSFFLWIWTLIWFCRKWRYCQSMIWILLCKILWIRMRKWHFTLVYNTIFKKHEWVFCAAFIFHMPLFMMLLWSNIWFMVYSTAYYDLIEYFLVTVSFLSSSHWWFSCLIRIKLLRIQISWSLRKKI